MKYVFILFLVFTCSLTANAQDNTENKIDSLESILVGATLDGIKIDLLDQLVYAHFSINSRKKMYEYLRQLTELSLERNHTMGVFRSHYYKGLILFNMEMDFDQASVHYYNALRFGIEKGVKNPKTFSELYNQLGLFYKNISQYDSALFYYEKASVINKANNFNRLQMTNYINLSKLNEIQGNINQALLYAEKCNKLGEQYNDQNAIFHSYQLYGDIYTKFKANELALEYVNKAKVLALKIYGEDASYTNYINGKLGILHDKLGNHELANSFYKTNIAYLKTIYGSDHPQLASPYYEMGKGFIELDQYDSAEFFLKKALYVSNLINSTHNDWKVGSLVQLGHLNILKENYNQARSYLESALEANSGHYRNEMVTYWLIGKLKFKEGLLKQSLACHQKALRYASEGFKDSLYFNNPSSKDIIYKVNAIDILRNKAEVMFEIGKSNDMKFLKESLKIYQLCDTMITDFRHHYQNNMDKISYNESKNDVYNGATALCHALYQKTQDQKYIEQAFYFSEKSKSSTLFDAILTRKAVKYANIPDSIITKENELKRDILYYHSKLENVRIRDTLKYIILKDKIFALNRNYQELISQMETNFPQYFHLKYNSKIFGLSQVSQNLGDKILLEYASYEDSLYVFVVNSKIQKLISIPKPREFDRWSNDFKQSILQGNFELYRHVAHKLYLTLIQPVSGYLEAGREVVIVPEGSLWHINFDLLLENENQGAEFSEWPYLLRNYAISYANSANVLLNKKQADRWMNTNCLAFAYSGKDSKWYSDHPYKGIMRDVRRDLPGSRKEIKNISNLVPGNYYYGDDATERNFKENGHTYSLLHLALHGDIEDTNPMLSKLFFSPLKADSIEDNLLHIYEVYDMNLNADMLVLSACNTGVGTLRNGEGIMSLGRAFQYAGVKSVVFSNWAVPDDTAPIIMKYFYTNLKEGQSKSQALKNAKLEYLKGAKLYKGNPFYWGNFMIIGDSSAVSWNSPKSVNLYLAVGSVVMAFLVLFIMVEMRKRKNVTINFRN